MISITNDREYSSCVIKNACIDLHVNCSRINLKFSFVRYDFVQIIIVFGRHMSEGLLVLNDAAEFHYFTEGEETLRNK